MLIKPDGSVQRVSVAEHLQRKALVYQDPNYSVYLYPNKKEPFVLKKGRGECIYIDWFALRFGQKERLQRKIASGWTSIHYGCARAERDALLLLPLDEIVERNACHCCTDNSCQYWSHATGLKGRYAFNCILIRYRAMGHFDQKAGLTLQEVGRIYGCTRERVRQIQQRALERLRHHRRLGKMKIFREHIVDYRDFTSESSLEAVG